MPYGNKTPEFLIERGTAITTYFLSQNIDTIVIACHTSSATSLPALKKLFPHVTYIDMLAPTINMAIKKTKTNRIGIMATQTSINSHVHKKMLLAQKSSVSVFEQACPDFVPLVERGASQKECKPVIENYLSPLLKEDIDTLILGCTHYAFLESLIQKQAPHLTLISAASYLKEPVIESVTKPAICIKSTGANPLAMPKVKSFQEAYIRLEHNLTI